MSDTSVFDVVADLRAALPYKPAKKRGRPAKTVRKSRISERSLQIAERYVQSAGRESMQDIATDFGISRERVRQIVEMIYPNYQRPPRLRLSKEERKFWRLKIRTALFWSLVAKGNDSDCWLWTGYCHPKTGYGSFRFSAVMGKKNTGYAHRVAWVLTNGMLPGGLDVLHKCDNPPCCNPAHLWLGTQADNNADRDAKGRGGGPKLKEYYRTHPGVAKARSKNIPRRLGINHPMRKIDDDIVREIRALYSRGKFSARRVAEHLGISEGIVYSVISGKTWSHVK